MLPKEDRDLILKIGRYNYNKMKKLNLTYEQFLKFEEERANERKIKQKMGYREYNKMKELGFNQEQYKQYQKEQKLKKYEKKREKDKIRQKTVRYIERYCNLEMKCQICETKKDVQIHHPNYKDYLKVNLLCIKHHNDLHNFELVPPQIIDLEIISIKTPPMKKKKQQIESQIENIKEDIENNGYTYKDIYKKYGIEATTIKNHLVKNGYSYLNKTLKDNGKRKNILKNMLESDNLIKRYQIKHNLTAKEISKITKIPLPTIRAISSGKTDIKNIRYETKLKLEKLKEAI